MAKQKYYVVWKGSEPGIYESWEEAKARIDGWPGAKYKSFATLDQARQAYDAGHEAFIGASANTTKGKEAQHKINLPPETLLRPAWGVDAACSGVPGPVEYRGVDLETGKMIFQQGPYPGGSNNIGEFLAIVHALALLAKKGDHTTAIYTDSKVAMGWVKQKKTKTTIKRRQDNAKLFELLERAEQWLRTHSYSNPIKKWLTDEWGEIPADYGRK
jgi:ribonuclease HI